MSTPEQDRLKKLRDNQVAARDPLVKQQKFQRSTSAKEKRMRKPFSITKAWAEIPHIIKAPFYGLILGVAVMFILPRLWISSWSLIASAGATLAFILYGVVVGNSLDIRDKLRDHIK